MIRIAFLALVAGVACTSLSAEETSVGLLSLLEDYRNLAPADSGLVVKDQDVSFEHLEILLDDGVADDDRKREVHDRGTSLPR